MLLYIVIAQDESGTITDVVLLSHRDDAEGIARDVRHEYPDLRVTLVVAGTDELPAFWGLEPPKGFVERISPNVLKRIASIPNEITEVWE